MLQAENQNHESILAHWTYSREEWKQFIRWKKRKKGWFHYFLHFLNPHRSKNTPEIRITPVHVSIGDIRQHFCSPDHQVKKIDIRDEGRLNIMEISYERTGRKKADQKEIRIPVPKGRIREAIELQERLYANQFENLD